MLRDRAGTYFIDGNRNCAESILLAANEEYSLGLKEGDERLIAGFGAGMGCGKTCGALAGSLSVLGWLMVRESAHKTEGFGKACAELVRRFKENCSDTDCAPLKAKYRREGVRCLDLVQTAADILDEYLREIKLI